MRKIRVLLWSSAGSFLFETFKWFWQGTDYSAHLGGAEDGRRRFPGASRRAYSLPPCTRRSQAGGR